MSVAVPLSGEPEPVTFSKDIAPVLHEHCASCHRPGGLAPFSLLTYQDARPRAAGIAAAVRSRTMPPWPPDPGVVELVGERRLPARAVDLIEEWAVGGALEGDRSDLPALAPSVSGWQLGTPDLVIELPEYQLTGRADEFRNFVVNVPGAGVRYVRGLEFQPRGRAVHHANIFIDRTSASRDLDQEDPRPGYEGVVPYSAQFPVGHFLGWTPGQIAPLSTDDLPWRLDLGSDLLVQMHLMRGGDDRMQPAIGLYFATQPPVRTPAILRLGRQNLDIGAGEPAYITGDSFVLPVDVEVRAVQPHAHYRATSVKAWADLPDGSRRWLISISRWNFDWQDHYRYVRPLALPAGTRFSLEYVFDNSSGNRRNPVLPPSRVRWGQRSSDEMADLWVQMVTSSDQALQTLNAALTAKMIREDLVGHEIEVAARPDSVMVRNDLAVLYLEVGDYEGAARHFLAVARLQPQSARAHFNLATAWERGGRRAEALTEYRRAVDLDPEYWRAHRSLAGLLLVDGRYGEAVDEYRQVLIRDPDDVEALNNQSFALLELDDPTAALVALQRAVSLKGDYADAHYNLARALARTRKPREAVREFREVLRLHAEWVPALTGLAWLLATSADAQVRDPGSALRAAERAVDLSGRSDAGALDALAAAYAAVGRFDEAQRTAEAAQAVARDSADLSAAIRKHLESYRAGRAIVEP